MDDRVVSFDADGTLVKRDLVDRFWFEEIPSLYADQEGISFDEALDDVKGFYDEIGPRDIRWYLPSYWFDRLGIDKDPIKVIEGIKHHKEVYPDALDVLEDLDGEYRMIVISNAPRKFLEVQLQEISDYFMEIYSCVSDLEKVKKDTTVYREVLDDIDVEPENLVHVGDDYDFDFLAPRDLGVETYFIDRERRHSDSDGVIRDLRDIVDILKC